MAAAVAPSKGTPLQAGYSFWYMKRGKNSSVKQDKQEDTSGHGGSSNPYESSIKIITTVNTVEEYWETYNYLTRPCDLPATTDYHFFREGIKPTWEDASNMKGGKWIVRLKKGLSSRYWEEALLALIGCQFHGVPDGEICGAVVSIRYSEDILAIWNRNASDRDITERIRDAIKKILQLPSHAHLEYKPHQTSLQDKSSFRNTQVWKPKSSMGERPDSRGRDNPRRSSSWGEREETRGGKGKSRDTERSWR